MSRDVIVGNTSISELGPPIICSIADKKPGLQGYLVIDSTINRHCSGELRMASNLSPDELARVARAMTLKYGFLGLPMGGAKSGVVANPETISPAEKHKLLRAFAKALTPFFEDRFYVTGDDSGTKAEDINLG